MIVHGLAESALAWYAAVAFGITIVYYIYWQATVGRARRKLIAQYGCQPVNREVTDIIGWDRFLKLREDIQNDRLLEKGPENFATLGNTFITRVLGKDVLLTIEPENVKTVLSLNFKHWSLGSTRISAFTPLLGRGIFTTDGDAWQHSRDMLRPNFHKSQVGDPDTFAEHADHLLAAIPRDGSTVDLQDLFFRMTMDSATEFLFGESTGTLKPGLGTVSHSKFAECFMRAQDVMMEAVRTNTFTQIHRWRQWKKDCDYVHNFVDAYVEKNLQYRDSLGSEKALSEAEVAKQPPQRYVFLRELVKQTSNKEQIRNELLNILLAGRDTTASLLANSWFMLARRPDVWTKLKAEVAHLHGERPTYEQIKDMKYLRAFLNESLRIHPVVPGNMRTATQDTVLPRGGGPNGQSPMFIRKGESLVWSVYSMHRRHDFYGPDSHDFKPERWLGEKGLRPGWEYLPFNGGPRICIGQQFALNEASYATIRLLQTFKKVEPRDNDRWKPWLTITVASKNGTKVSLTPENENEKS